MTNNHSQNNYVGIEDVARYLNLKASTIRTWIKDKDFPAHKIGRLWRFKLSEVDSWIENGDPKFSEVDK